MQFISLFVDEFICEERFEVRSWKEESGERLEICGMKKELKATKQTPKNNQNAKQIDYYKFYKNPGEIASPPTGGSQYLYIH